MSKYVTCALRSPLGTYQWKRMQTNALLLVYGNFLYLVFLCADKYSSRNAWDRYKYPIPRVIHYFPSLKPFLMMSQDELFPIDI